MPVSSSLRLKVAYEGQAATVWGSLLTRFLTRCNEGGMNRLWRRNVGGKSTANYYLEVVVLEEAAVANGGCVASLVATDFVGGS